MPIGWFFDLAQAEDYFDDERLDAEAWDLLDSTQKPAALTQAYNRIYYSKEFIVPTYAEATAGDLVVLRKAQGEFAYYLAIHARDEDRRKGLQAQAVIKAGVVKEDYDAAKLYDTPIPPFVRDLLCAYLAGDPGQEFGAVDLCRDEGKSVGEKVCDLD